MPINPADTLLRIWDQPGRSEIKLSLLRDVISQRGAAYYSNANEGLSTRTSSTFGTKVTLAVTGLTAGVYVLRWYAEVAQSLGTSTTDMRVTKQPSGAPVALVARAMTASPLFAGESGFATLSLAAGNHTFRLQWRSVTGVGTASIRKARLSLEKVS